MVQGIISTMPVESKLFFNKEIEDNIILAPYYLG